MTERGQAHPADKRRGHAVVLGASMAGLLTARVLSESFASVTVLERGDLAEPGDRRGVPQGRHVHALLARGERILAELFPGITDELLADGAVQCRSLTEMRMSIAGYTLSQSDAGYSLLQASRPFLEWRVRQRVRALPNVEIQDRCTVLNPLTDPARTRVTGVLAKPENSDHPNEIFADLVVSCLGRHGPIIDWLTAIDYPRPAEEGVRIDMMYASRYIRLPDHAATHLRGDKEIVVANQDPARGLALFAVEDGRHILTLIGYGADHPPTDSDGFWRFASSVAPPDVAQALLSAESLTGISTYRYPANQRRRYERLSRFPDGLLVLGDAVCSFSPAFGQGMSVSALQAMQLRDVLAAGDHDLARRFFRAAAHVIDDPWLITRLFDLAMPHVDAKGQVPIQLLGLAARTAMAIGARDATVGQQISRIAGLLDRPLAVARPTLLTRIAANAGVVGLNLLREVAVSGRPERVSGFGPIPLTPAHGFHPLPVRAVERDTGDSVLIEFEVPDRLADRFGYTAGQHVVIRGTADGQPIRRSYSLCDAPDAGRLRIAVKRQDGGLFSEYALERLAAGTVLHVGEPAGAFTAHTDPGAAEHHAAVAAGSGITPIAAIAAAVLANDPHSRFTLYHASRDSTAIMLGDLLGTLTARFPGRLRIVHHLSRQTGTPLPPATPGIDYRHGRMDIHELPALDADHWYLCGPDSLLSTARAELLAGGIAASRVYTERFRTREPEPVAPQPDRPTCTVTLTGHGEDLVFTMPQGDHILDAALTHREDLPYSCLGGSCGTCIATVRSGTVQMDEDPMTALTAAEIADGAVLTCRSVPESAAVTLRFGR
ncbi:2Fe-2S iron-sulfur cluster binding domain-containing protein [Nocardia sp. CA2R105]|uniref:2Fe-2S iron-sulfur cluster-binding protein n=1 Tax=Nocardia coffeae TaxID=2873381 RepID=UPI001CA71F5E|nr:2Fe-2S iron-sulfur cluster-binding protein [Nocardia coffeae]MBY8855463.1 2Fe-2S iron-sulfur cluster binding domain-containing protein [Nocardia coffeae]